MVGRLVTLAVSGVLVVVMVAAGWYLPVPYVREAPGPTYNTIGDVDGRPVVSVTGRKTYSVSGHLNMTTVSVIGGPGNQPSLGQVLTGWVDPNVAVVPEEIYYPEGTTRQQIEKESAEQFQSSEDEGTVAALRHVGIPVKERLIVKTVQKDMPAEDELHAGDQIWAINGVRTPNAASVQKQMGKYEPGDRVRITVKRKGEQSTVALKTVPAPDNEERAIVGIELGADYTYPVKVRIRLQNVGGPSAGLMFSLAIVDLLTERQLADGRFIAGTGTMDSQGKVDAIGGVTQKMVAAKDEGATVFLTPSGNCAEARRTAPDGMRLVKVGTLEDAVDALDTIRTGDGAVPSCDGS
ncbi:MAG: PDZ domain-containing protein [Streptosporangiales bacterium]|nr:PDZ domain-containing protein [Streptosporangiales bacterium]